MPVELSALVQPSDSRIVIVVVDGLGGFADGVHGTELEEAQTPNLDLLAAEGATGLLEPVGPGITPGSGPGHLALFGYDPLEFELGRGALSAAGLGVELKPGDVAARGNLATVAPANGRDDAIVLDRRAGRIGDEEAREVVRILNEKLDLGDVEVQLLHEAGHRVLVVLRGPGLDPRVLDTDPQAVGKPVRQPHAFAHQADRTAAAVRELDRQAREILAGEPRANALLLRGFDTHRELPSMQVRYGLNPAAIAVYPMYRGIARLVGMEVLSHPHSLEEQTGLLRSHWGSHDYFFFHHKPADSAGEDGNFEAKVAAIEAIDAAMPAVVELEPDVLIVTGDHATPSQMAAHSWHPVPVLVRGAMVGRDDVDRFGERWCRTGGLGRRRTVELMPIVLSCAGRLSKYGA